MSKLLDYYEEELRYLIEGGREFAALHPDRAQFLTPDDPRARDPHVERLLEAFAFLVGRIRMRMDDDYPELTQALLSLVWPHYLKPVPSLAMLELSPKEGMIQEPVRVARGALVDSDPVPGGRACRFATCYDVDLLPLAVERAELAEAAGGGAVLRLRFRAHAGADLSRLRDVRLRLFLAGETTVTYELYRMLAASASRMSVNVLAADGTARARELPGLLPEPAGLSSAERVLPADERSFPGFRLLQEYFLFPEKFLYVTFPLGRALADAAGAAGLELVIAMSEAPPKGLRVQAANFRLHCTPAINLFPREAEPIRLDRKASEYRVIADFSRPDDFEVYGVTSVEAISRTSKQRVAYRPLHAFHHLAAGKEHRPYYVVTSRPSATRAGWDTYLSFPVVAGAPEPEAETVSCELLCTNGALPVRLRLGQIRHPAGGIPDFVRVANITQPTAPIWPPLEGGADWRFIAHLAFNLVSLRDLDTLRGVLALYAEGGERGTVEANRRRIEGVRDVSLAPAQALHRGSVIRGTDVRIEVNEDHFSDQGDLRMFTAVLAEFLALYASINSFVRLTVVAQPSGTRLACAPKFSTRTRL